jgi:hypothetical protein
MAKRGRTDARFVIRRQDIMLGKWSPERKGGVQDEVDLDRRREDSE